jgi:hypothetical protein
LCSHNKLALPLKLLRLLFFLLIIESDRDEFFSAIIISPQQQQDAGAERGKKMRERLTKYLSISL